MTNENRPRPSHAAPGVRQNLDYPVIPLYQFLDDAVSSFPDAPAAIFAGSIQTYRDLGGQAARLDWWAAALVLLAYAVVLAGLGIWRASREDVS